MSSGDSMANGCFIPLGQALATGALCGAAAVGVALWQRWEDAAAMGRLIEAFQRAWVRLEAQLTALLGEIGQMGASVAPLRGSQIARMNRYQTLMGQLMQELQGLQSLTMNEVERAAELGITLGSESVGTLLSTIITGNTRLAAGFNRLPVEAIKAMLGFLTPGSALYERLSYLAPGVAQAVADAIIQGVALGWNPRKIAAMVQQAFGGGLTDALRFVRTAQIWAFRESNRANMLANSDVVEGWFWNAELGDPRTCASCIAKHGSFHPLSERLEDHHCGRCTAIPKVRGFESPLIEASGEAWFIRQSETFQRSVLGKSKYEAWKANQFEFSQLSQPYDDPVYGRMFSEASLKELVNH